MATTAKKNRDKKRIKIERKKLQHLKAKNEMNPFELHHNKIKHKILGRKIAKNEFGKPLINRNRAFKKREQTLLEEYKNKHKSGKGLQDLREKDAEQRIINKYKQEQNRIRLNENDDIKLTHKGKPLEDLIDDRISDDDEELDLFNRDDYVERAHFGGGQDGPPRSKNDILNEIMAEKMKIKLDREETISLTEKLDSQWNEIKNLIRHKGSNQTSEKGAHDEYDSLLTQLVFDDQNQVKESKTNKTESSSTSLIDDNLSQTPDSLFKNKLNLIDGLNDPVRIIKTIKEIIDLLSKISQKSFVILKERLISLSKSNLKFSPKEMTILILSAYFKEFQVFIHVIVLKTLNKIKYSSLNEVACSIFLVNFLLRTTSKDKFYPELFIHLDNLVCLCLPKTKTRLRLFHRLEYEADCILNVGNFNDNFKNDSKYSVTLTNLFSEKFKTEDKLLAYNLAFQVFKLLSCFHEKYSSLSTIGYLLKPTMAKISVLIDGKLNSQMRNLLNEIVAKIDKNSSKSIIVNTAQAKPFMLPLLEPKYEENSFNSIRPKASEHKKLIKKYKREFRGAQREIRKDSKFLRETYLKEMEKKDRIRNKKVKEILRDLSVQQGLYKKKK